MNTAVGTVVAIACSARDDQEGRVVSQGGHHV